MIFVLFLAFILIEDPVILHPAFCVFDLQNKYFIFPSHQPIVETWRKLQNFHRQYSLNWIWNLYKSVLFWSKGELKLAHGTKMCASF